MGSESSLSVGMYCVCSVSHHIDGDVFDLFRENELETTTETEDGYETTTRCFSAPAHVIRDRLDVMGISANLAKVEFQRGIAKIAVACNNEWPFDGYSFEDWRGIVGEIRERGYADFDAMSPIAKYFLEGHEATSTGFPLIDSRLHLRAAIEEFDPHTPVTFYLDDMYDPEREPSDYVESRIDGVNIHCTPNRRLIVLTEGSTDVSILKGSLELLYPHLVEFVSFMDFQSVNLGGGAPDLVRILKAFAGVGIVNRVVAVFDNDTAATEAIASLRDTKLPSTVRWIQLPRTRLASCYPALSPAGSIELTDLNGLAGSIEMYFGEDILRRPDGQLTPVHWRGFNAKLNRYQGELADKALLQQGFTSKLRECLTDRQRIIPDEWADMKSIIQAVCLAFN